MTVDRIYAVTGSASGIGKAVREKIEREGSRVIGIDLRDAEVIADLGTPSGRAAMVKAVTRETGGRLDAVVACAGIGGRDDRVVRINYFGAVATLEGLRPLLAVGSDPAAVAIGSVAAIHAEESPMVEACRDGDEERAAAASARMGTQIYAGAKLSLTRWVRRQAPEPEWAGAGIALNVVAPGVVITPASAHTRSSEKGRAIFAEMVPMPFGGWMEPEDVAPAITWLAGAENRSVTGQIVFVDRGADTMLRGDARW